MTRILTSKVNEVLPEIALTEAQKEGAKAACKELRDRLMAAVVGRDTDGDVPRPNTIELMLTALFADRHILLEDFPGSGKTVMAETLGTGLVDDRPEDGIVGYKRIQCTPDLLPSDITGYHKVGDKGGEEFVPGPVFAYVVLLDEINRTTPKVQSAMLEAMAEQQVTVDGIPTKLGAVFMVIATQNPLDRLGTYELTYAQLDRFLFKRLLKPISHAHVKTILEKHALGKHVPKEATVHMQKVAEIQEWIEKLDYNFVTESDGLTDHLAAIYKKFSASNLHIKKGTAPSVRAIKDFRLAMRANAYVRWALGNQDTLEATAEHAIRLACDVLGHRIELTGNWAPGKSDAGKPSEDDKNDYIIKQVRDAIEESIRERT